MTRCVPQEKKVFFFHITNLLLTEFGQLRMAGCWPRSIFCVFKDLDTTLGYKHAEKAT